MSQLHETPSGLKLQNDLLTMEVMGGIKIDGLDRMRSTLKIALVNSPRPPFRHTLDLYNDTQLEKFIRKVAERLEIGTSVIAASLADLTSQLESYRLMRIEQKQEKKKVKPLSASEKADAVEDLSAENLQAQTKKDLKATGIIGEETNAMILLYAMSSRKLRDPLSVICLAKSGVGKSYLMEKVAACMPEEEIKETTSFTGASFYHFERDEIKGKIFLIEDLDGAQEVMFPIRELQTKKRISKTMAIKEKNGGLRTVTLTVEGPVSVIGCTTKEKIYEDNANRSLLIHLDGSKEQDERIMNYQRQHKAGQIDSTEERRIQSKLKRMQQVLEPITVINPYAPLIDLPQEVFKPRRTLPLLLSFIEAITFYHQAKRAQRVDESTGEMYIETSPADIENGFELLEDVLFRKADELSGAAREFYEQMKVWDKKRDRSTDPKQGGFFASMIRQETQIHPRTLSRYLQELCDFGLIEITGGNQYRAGYSYKVRAGRDFQSIQKSIEEQIKKVKEAVRAAHIKRTKPKAKRGRGRKVQVTE